MNVVIFKEQFLQKRARLYQKVAKQMRPVVDFSDDSAEEEEGEHEAEHFTDSREGVLSHLVNVPPKYLKTHRS